MDALTDERLAEIEVRRYEAPRCVVAEDVRELVDVVRGLRERLGLTGGFERRFAVKLARAKQNASWEAASPLGYHDTGRWRRADGRLYAACSCGARVWLDGEDGAWVARGDALTVHCAEHHSCPRELCPEGYEYRRAKYGDDA